MSRVEDDRPDIPEDIWDVALRLAEEAAFDGYKVRSETKLTDAWALVDEANAVDIARAILAERLKERAAWLSTIEKPFALVFLDGRNEYGAHVLSSLPLNVPPNQFERDLEEQQELILTEAERLGYSEGQHVWTEWRFDRADEYDGYWEFVGINKEITDHFVERELQAIRSRP
jgi:hypothetical protein